MPRRRPPADAHRLGPGGLLLFVLAIAAFVALVVTPWMGRGLAVLLPAGWAQVAFGLALPAAVVGCFAAGTRRPPHRPYPWALTGTIAGLLTVMFLLAPVGRSGTGSGRAVAAAESVRPLLLTLYPSWPALLVVLGVIALLDRRRRRRRGEDPDATDVRRPLPAPRTWLVATGVPAAFAVVTVTVGVLAGTPPPPVDLAGDRAGDGPTGTLVRVPELAGTLLETEQLSTIERPAEEARDHYRLDELTGGATVARAWSAGAVTADRLEAPTGFWVEVLVAELAPGTDPAAAAATLATQGPELAGGWRAVSDVREGRVSAAVVDDRTLYLLEVGRGLGTPARERARARLAGELTPHLRSVLAAATRPGG